MSPVRDYAEELDGYAYLPRMFDKARAKLAGDASAPPFGCPLDHSCLARLHVYPEEVLDLARIHGDDDQAILEGLQQRGIPAAADCWFDARSTEDELLTDVYLRVRPIDRIDEIEPRDGDEILVIEEGEALITLGDKQRRIVRAGEVVRIPPELPHTILRPATDDDRDAVFALGVAEEAAWFGTPEVSAPEVGEWIDDEGGVTQGVVAIADGRVRGFASSGRTEAVFLAEPAATERLAEVLLPWLRERGDVVQLMTYAGDAKRIEAFERHGLRHSRSLFTLARSLDVPLPPGQFAEGVEVQRYSLGTDDEAAHRLIYVDAEWAAVPGHTERDLDSWRSVARPCQSLFLVRRGERPIGWVAGRLLDSGRGFIETLAVATDERGHGLGRALLLHAFADLERQGATSFGLGVEAQNAAALGLYRSVGLEIEREWRKYSNATS